MYKIRVIRRQIHDFLSEGNSNVMHYLNVYELFANEMKCRKLDIENGNNLLTFCSFKASW